MADMQCPKCQSSNIRGRSGWRPFLICVVGIVLFAALSGAGGRLGPGATAGAVLLSILAIPALIRGATSRNQCLACHSRWR